MAMSEYAKMIRTRVKQLHESPLTNVSVVTDGSRFVTVAVSLPSGMVERLIEFDYHSALVVVFRCNNEYMDSDYLVELEKIAKDVTWAYRNRGA